MWPPAYKIKEHPRAKYVKLKTSIEHGLELVVPKRFNLAKIPAILEKNKEWILKKIFQWQEARALVDQTTHLPSELHFPSVNQVWKIDYLPIQMRLKIIVRPHQQLVLMGNLTDNKTCCRLIEKWIKDKSKAHLLSRLADISRRIQLPYSKAMIRNQRTRWGSCSIDGSINLNYKLLFMPPELVDHIIIHELCHTVHMNHSEQFWQLVATFDPNWKSHRQLMKQAGKNVPRWL